MNNHKKQLREKNMLYKETLTHERNKILAYWNEYFITDSIVAKSALAIALSNSIYLFNSLYAWDCSDSCHEEIQNKIHYFDLTIEQECKDEDLYCEYINFKNMSYIGPAWDFVMLEEAVKHIDELVKELDY